MRRVVAVILLATMVISVPGALANQNEISFSILPGTFSVQLAAQNGRVMLDIDDSTGTSQGWWVTIDCTCQIIPVSAVITVAGNEPDSQGGPKLVGNTVVAGARYGSGHYRLEFAESPGEWTLTSGQGQRPSF